MKKRYLFFALFTGLLACQQPTDVPKTSPQPAPPPPPKSGPFEQPDWAKSAVLYELNTRNFSVAGNFDGVTKELPRLRELGVDVIWLMPIHPIGVKNRKGSLGSPYSVQDYLKINPDFGDEAALRRLVGTAHELGLKVILDWVPNHTSWDNIWLTTRPGVHTIYNGAHTVPLNEHGEPIADWSDVMDLDYSKPATRAAMIEAMQFWLKNFDVDGFRVDMAGLVPNDFWAEARPALDSVKPVFMLSEWQDEPLHFKSAFNANYAWKWKDVTKDIWAGKRTALALDSLKTELDDFYPEGYYQVHFTQNHDENSWNGTEKQLYGASADAFTVLAFTWAGMPMLYNGQEDNLAQRLKFFDRDPIRWKGRARTEFFQKLCALRHNNRALWSGTAGGPLEKIGTNADDKIYAFTRERDGDRVIVIANLSKQPQSATLATTSDMAGAYTNLFGNNSIQVTKDMQFNLKAWEYIVLTNR
ncbi:MAG: alpha-amylase family glycosyl hydrolase [Saprospiraceae bacterium]